MGTRTTLVRLQDGGLWVHAPGPLDAEIRAEVDARGPVRHIVGPNKFHHFFIGDWARAYPDARTWAAPGLADKKKNVAFHEELSDRAPSEWSDELDQHLVQGAPQIGEVVFFHRASRTLILVDLAFNIHRADSWVARAAFRMLGAWDRFGTSRLGRFYMKDRAAVRESIDHLLEWDFDRVVLTHGDVIESDGHEAVRRSFEWLQA